MSAPSFRLRLLVVALLGAIAMPAASCGGEKKADAGRTRDSKASSTLIAGDALRGAQVTVGSKEFTEQIILGKLTVAVLEAGGAQVVDRTALGGSSEARSALRSGRIDAYWEYTGTGWLEHLGNDKPIRDPRAQWRRVADADRTNGLTWLDPAPANNTYAFAVRSEAQASLGVRKISDFARLIKERPTDANLCVGKEFRVRNDGLPGVERAYGFKFPRRNVFRIEEGVIYSEVDRGGRCNFGEVFATDGRIAGNELAIIEDDKRFFPAYNPSLVVRSDVVRRHPRIREVFAAIAAKLDDRTLQRLNERVDVDGLSEDEVARGFLRQNGFVR